MADNPLKLSSHAQGQVESGFDTGDLRRRYDFSNRVSELSPDQTPFFRVLSKVAKKATTDPEFKTLEQRHMWHKRYAYATAMDLNGGAIGTGDNDSDYSDYSFLTGDLQLNDEMNVKFETDYLSAGNVQNILGQTGNLVGATGTKPIFFLVDQVVKIPVRTFAAVIAAGLDNTAPTGYTEDYIMVKITALSAPATSPDAQAVYAKCRVIRGVTVGTDTYWTLPGAQYHHGGTTFDAMIATAYKEADKCYVVGSAHAEGSGFPDTYKDTPYKDVVGYTQIWKTTMQMTNTARATELKLARDEWARVWKNKLIEHKWDIETDILFSSKQKDTDGVRYTAGIVDYVLSSGNIFSINIVDDKASGGTTSDDFLQNMSDFMDPRYNSANATMFMCDTATYNWLHKLGGFQANTIDINSQFRYDFAVSGKKSLFGIPVTQITTPYGDMNVVRNVHLDGSPVKILAVNLKHVSYRPLVGNGVNRDTSVYVGVQSLENTGTDRRIDLIQTEAGLEVVMPEAHAVWK
jgi:hypothetical protein